MKILITGGAGFIGSHLSDALLAAGGRWRSPRRNPTWPGGRSNALSKKYVSRCAITRRTGLIRKDTLTGNTELLSMYCSSALWRMLSGRTSGCAMLPVFWSPGNSCCTWSLRSCVRSVIPIAAPTQDCSRLCFGFTEKRETHRFFAIRAGYYRRTAAKITCKTGCFPYIPTWCSWNFSHATLPFRKQR